MTKAQITAAMKGTDEPVVLQELGPDDDHAAILADYQRNAPKNVGVYLRRPSAEREEGRVIGLNRAAIMGRIRVQ